MRAILMSPIWWRHQFARSQRMTPLTPLMSHVNLSSPLAVRMVNQGRMTVAITKAPVIHMTSPLLKPVFSSGIVLLCGRLCRLTSTTGIAPAVSTPITTSRTTPNEPSVALMMSPKFPEVET